MHYRAGLVRYRFEETTKQNNQHDGTLAHITILAVSSLERLIYRLIKSEESPEVGTIRDRSP